MTDWELRRVADTSVVHNIVVIFDIRRWIESWEIESFLDGPLNKARRRENGDSNKQTNESHTTNWNQKSFLKSSRNVWLKEISLRWESDNYFLKCTSITFHRKSAINAHSLRLFILSISKISFLDVRFCTIL